MSKDLDALAFCPELVSLFSQTKLRTESGKEFAESGTKLGLGAFSTINNLVILKNLFAHVKPKRTLEIGMAFGGSSLLFAALFRQAGEPPAKQHVAIDPFQSNHWEGLGVKALERSGLAGYATLHEELSSLALPKMVVQGDQYDLIYVDGSHLFEDVFIDAYFTAQLLALHGVVAFDDCRDPHVLKVIHFLRRNRQDSLEEVDLSPFRDDQGKSLKYQVAKKMGRTQMTAFRRIGPATRPWNAPLRDF